MGNTLLDQAGKILGWPGREDLFDPSGAAKSVMAKTADRKIGDPLRRLEEAAGAKVGILSSNPRTDTTDSPLALICEFHRPVGPSVLARAQRLAWNFSLSPLLITVEPHIIRSFTCCEQVRDEKEPDRYEVEQIRREDLRLSERAARALHWVSLISGAFYQEHERRFRRDQRADHQLLSNMRYVRKKLLSGEHGLSEDICHDLLARVIFIQFLLDRKDAVGNSALDSAKLKEICGQDRLGKSLRDKESAYKLFGYLNLRFNGDLFSGNGRTDEDSGLRKEKTGVDQSHLTLLAELVEGDLAMAKDQYCLWKQYAFDVIPLEFISSIYEEFVTKRTKEGVYYTPQHLVDFVLDGVLPWTGDEWDLKILDPACGSAVFLVKAFQRLVYRWGVAHNRKKPTPDVLRHMLERNIFGVDSSNQAVRVASFSLYLAMCDYIEPVDLWKDTTFPKLRGRRIVRSDFFSEDVPGIRTDEDTGSYDLVIGNPPWGKDSITEPAMEWARGKGWRPAGKDIGPIFLLKAAAISKQDGYVSMLQPAKPLLFNRSGPAQEFRKRLFETFKVEEVTNLAAVRFLHFKSSNSPVSIITLRPTPPDGEPFTYICPKPGNAEHDKDLIIVDPQDVQVVFPREASTEPEVWTALMWGGRRDLALVRSLKRTDTLEKFVEEGVFKSRGRIIRGKTKRRQDPELVGRPILEKNTPVDKYFLRLPASDLESNQDPRVHFKDTSDMSGFEPPQLVLKQSWSARSGRFMSFVVEPDQDGQGLITSLSFVSVHAPSDFVEILEVACLTYNSILAVYYLLLTSGQFAAERPKVLETEALSVPIPEPRDNTLAGLRDYSDVDSRVRHLYELSDVEWTLIEDAFMYTVPYFKGKKPEPAQATKREMTGESELERYSEYFLKVLRAGFGEDKPLSCVAFVESQHRKRLPVRLLAVYLDSPLDAPYDIEEIGSTDLYGRLSVLYNNLLKADVTNAGGILFQRIARVYDVTPMGGKNVPTVYIIKPDQARYWTRSMALRDADEVSADIMSWSLKGDFSSRFQGAMT